MSRGRLRHGSLGVEQDADACGICDVEPADKPGSVILVLHEIRDGQRVSESFRVRASEVVALDAEAEEIVRSALAEQRLSVKVPRV